MISLDEFILHNIQLKTIELVELVCKKNYNFDYIKKEKTKIPVKISSWGEITSDVEGDAFLNIVLGKIDETPFYIDITQKGKCCTSELLEKEKFENFLESQGIRLIWSFIRQEIFNLTSKMGNEITAYLLPTIDVIRAVNYAKNKDDKNEPTS